LQESSISPSVHQSQPELSRHDWQTDRLVCEKADG
jgi:hypothetical protein